MTTGSQGREEVAGPGTGSAGNLRPEQLSTLVAHPGPLSEYTEKLSLPGVARQVPPPAQL